MMKTLLAATALLTPLAATPVFAADVSVCFTPGGDCTGQVVNVLNGARRSIHVEAFLFTSKPIEHALAAAKARGVDVRIILDKSHEKPSAAAQFFMANGLPPLVDDTVKTAHNKIMIVDGQTVITGSFNYTHAAQAENAENLVIIRDPGIAQQYEANFRRRTAASHPFHVAAGAAPANENEQ